MLCFSFGLAGFMGISGLVWAKLMLLMLRCKLAPGPLTCHLTLHGQAPGTKVASAGMPKMSPSGDSTLMVGT